MWNASSEFGHTCRNRDSVFEASRTFATAPRPWREERSPCAVNPHLQLITGERRPRIEGIEATHPASRSRLASHGESMKDA